VKRFEKEDLLEYMLMQKEMFSLLALSYANGFASKKRSQSIAALHPLPAATIA
jgi:hypothetical protein